MKPWKVQKFFGDVVYDLRSRGLLPVAILLILAMVAVPLLIARGSSDSSSAALQPSAASAEPAPEIQSAVVSYDPGIRNYQKRLDDLSPKNPFRQQFAQSAAAASELNSTAPEPTSSGSSEVSSGGSTESTPPSDGGGSSPEKKSRKKSSPTTYSYAVSIMAGAVDATLTPFPNIPDLTTLPSQTTPVAVYYGLSSDHSKALFLVSNKVAGLTGPGTCLPAPDDCSLLALGAGQSEDLVYSLDGKTYRIVVSQIKRSAK
jgi:hypothetical protein